MSNESAIIKSHSKSDVLIGLSGGPDSTVVAHLLRKQRLPLVGLGIAFLDDKYLSYFSDEFAASRSFANLERMKLFCESIDIPFYAVDASQEYFDRVFGPLLTARLSGQKFLWRMEESVLLMEILVAKAAKLIISQIATGH